MAPCRGAAIALKDNGGGAVDHRTWSWFRPRFRFRVWLRFRFRVWLRLRFWKAPINIGFSIIVYERCGID